MDFLTGAPANTTQLSLYGGIKKSFRKNKQRRMSSSGEKSPASSGAMVALAPQDQQQQQSKVYEMTDVEREFFKSSTIFKRIRLLPECTPEECVKIGTIINTAFDTLVRETRLPEGKEKDGCWEYLETRKNNVKIYRKASEDNPIKCVKAVAEVEGYTLAQIFDFLLSWDYASEYDKSLIVRKWWWRVNMVFCGTWSHSVTRLFVLAYFWILLTTHLGGWRRSQKYVLYELNLLDVWWLYIYAAFGFCSFNKVGFNALVSQGAYRVPWPMTSRDLVLAGSCKFTEKGEFIAVSKSVEIDACPERKGFIRADCPISGLIVTPLPNNTAGKPRFYIENIIQLDPKGWVPLILVNMVMVDALVVLHLSDKIESYIHFSKTQSPDIPNKTANLLAKYKQHIEKQPQQQQ